MTKFIARLGMILGLWTTAANAFAADSNPNYIKWEREIAAFERADATNPPPKGAVLFIGSSTIRLWTTLAKDLPTLKVINRGFGGSTIADSTHFADRIIFPYAPSRIVLRAGGNDLWAGKTATEVFKDFQEFVAVVHAKLPDTEIIFLGLTPSLARWKQAEQEKTVNRLIAEFVKGKPGLNYIETYDLPLGADGLPRAELFIADKLHFNAAGYELLAAKTRAFFAAGK